VQEVPAEVRLDVGGDVARSAGGRSLVLTRSIRTRRYLALLPAATLALSVAGGTSAAGTTLQGPSSSQTPYVVPLADGVVVQSILTVGDQVDDYAMVGIPDGLGAYDNGDGTFTLFLNHEIPLGSGVTRDHGANSAFVSTWQIDTDTREVLTGRDLIQDVATWDPDTASYNAAAQGVVLGRLCSADLPAKSAFWNASSQQGYDGRIFMDGEETGAEGRAFAHLENGTSYELPRLGKFSWENSVANPLEQNRTVVVGTDDSTPGEVYVYVGKKTKSGSPVDRAGLTNGQLYGIVVDGVATEDRTTGIGGPSKRFSLHNHGNVENLTGAQLQAADDAAAVTKFNRPEDGAWDPTNPDDFYFVTTDRFDTVKTGTGTQVGRSRLWRLRFDNGRDPAAGGTIELLLDGTEPHQMFDNMTVDRHGHVLIQEDPGNQTYLARIWQYTIATDELKAIAQHDPARFQPGVADPLLTQDEESSGIWDAEEVLGPGWFLLDVQAHYSTTAELVEGGQLLALWNPDTAAAAD
jgi:hypothetical protein